MKIRLMKAAMSAFIKKGLNLCTMDDVAKEANVGKGTSYLYFKSKEELMVVMYEHYALQTLELQKKLIAEAGDLSPRKLLDQVCSDLLADAFRHRKMFGLWFQFLALSSSPRLKATVKRILANNYRSHNEYLEEILERGIRANEFRGDINKRAVAVSITSLLEGLMVRDYADQSLVDLEQDYLAMTKIILDGIMARNEKRSQPHLSDEAKAQSEVAEQS